jgi:hypothetical protein
LDSLHSKSGSRNFKRPVIIRWNFFDGVPLH